MVALVPLFVPAKYTVFCVFPKDSPPGKVPDVLLKSTAESELAVIATLIDAPASKLPNVPADVEKLGACETERSAFVERVANPESFSILIKYVPPVAVTFIVTLVALFKVTLFGVMIAPAVLTNSKIVVAVNPVPVIVKLVAVFSVAVVGDIPL